MFRTEAILSFGLVLPIHAWHMRMHECIYMHGKGNVSLVVCLFAGLGTAAAMSNAVGLNSIAGLFERGCACHGAGAGRGGGVSLYCIAVIITIIIIMIIIICRCYDARFLTFVRAVHWLVCVCT
jgi:hypothetical protein